ncbi:unnamed protein product [Prunus armeniaca]
MALPRGVGGCAIARSPSPGLSQREVSFPDRYEGESRCVGGHGLDKILRTPRCDKTRSLLSNPAPSSPSPLYLLQGFIGSVPWRGDVEEPRLGRLWMEEAFTLAGPRLDWDTVVGVLRLVWLGTLSYASCAVVMLELDVLSMKMVIFLGHLGDTGTEVLQFCQEIGIC